MQLRTVPARTGLSWVRQGFVWLSRQPLRALLMMACYALAALGLSLTPVVGGLMPLMAVQVATVGFMEASARIARGEPVWPNVLLTGLRGPRAGAVLAVGALYCGAVVGVLSLGALLDGGALLRLVLFNATPPGAPGDMTQSGPMQNALLAAMAAYVPVSAAFWLAPALVARHGMGPWQALFTSLVIVTRNLGAFAIYVLQWLTLFTALPLVVALLASTAGAAERTAALLGLPVALALLLAFILSIEATAQSLLPPPGQDN